MNLKMITLKLAVAALASAMLLSQCISDPESTDSFRRSVYDRGMNDDTNATPADGTDVSQNDTLY